MEHYLLISDAAKEVQVESHVLRYWEEELHLPIRRNDLGHRYYTLEDVELFKRVKSMKEGGLQLKAIKMILKDGRINIVPEEYAVETEERSAEEKTEESMAIKILNVAECTENREEREPNDTAVFDGEGREEKARRLQWLLRQLIRETLRENNQEICREVKECVMKELDYQFRVQEERDEEREKARIQQEEEHFQKLDEILRRKSGRRERKEIQVEEIQEMKERKATVSKGIWLKKRR
jgi:DNA-binding transcriptional MerR regulator